MSKIDDFFHKNLTDYQEDDNQWNVPDDNIWEEAKVHFPKKKKRRGIFWLFGVIGLLALTTISITLLTNTNSNKNTKTNKHSVKNPNISRENQAELVDNAQIGLITDSPIEINEESKNLDRGPNKNVQLADSKPQEVSTLNTDKLISTKEILGEVESNTIINRSDLTLYNSDDINSGVNKQNELLSHQSVKETIADNRETVDELKVPSNNSNQDILYSDTPLLFAMIPSGSINPLDVHLKDYLLENSIVEEPEIKMPNAEFGISRNFYFLALVNGVNLGEDPRDEVYLNTDIKNINLNYRWWIAPKWSMQTGMYYSSLDGNLDFSVFFPATEEELEIITTSEYQEVVDQNDRNEDPSIMITLLNSPALNVGDEIFFEGNVSLELQAFQIPLMIHRHWYKKRIEFMIGAGITLEYLTAKQNGQNFNIGVNGTPVEAIISQPPIAAQYYDATVYIEAGTKYNITEKINAGATLRIAATAPIFSGIDLGLYYRW